MDRHRFLEKILVTITSSYALRLCLEIFSVFGKVVLCIFEPV